ncbi:hypothetical protein EAH89_13880 [Roseomonas nepalensis]|uniref:DUF4148 domain-containing protein n=1 Tax=Muricoccus nepalensis TaxID=1854500 RepID=A0A502G149_9PROT|nr:hypothetical protein [Roseomonas nepalensis]TPG55657.1 hypothetical protein EAH89_13880 [Roseomonas nepalensis]
MPLRAALILSLGALWAGPALAQGATGSVSRPGWSRGAAPSSDFNAQGQPMTRSEALRQRAAAARGQNGHHPARR